MVPRITWKFIPLYTLVTNRIFVDYVARHLHGKQKFEIMKELILENVRSSVNSVEQPLRSDQICSHTNELRITTINVTSAIYAPKDSKGEGMFNSKNDVNAN